MKKIISLLLCAAVTLGASAALADGNEQVSANMQNVLERVKTLVDIPAEFSEFESSVYSGEDITSYTFYWHDKENKESIQVQCDDKGRISEYWYSSDSFYSGSDEKKLSSVSREAVEEYALNFAKKALPEAFADETDCLVYDKDNLTVSFGSRYTQYAMRFDRMKNNAPVKGNGANITALVKDADIFINGMDVSFDYDAEFEVDGALYEDYINAYKEAYPLEMVYRKDYSYYYRPVKEDCDKIKLIYRIRDDKTGYISAYTGEAAEEDAVISLYGRQNAEAAADMGGGTGAAKSLTPAELSAISEIAGLKTVSQTVSELKKLAALKISDDMKESGSRYYKNDDMYILNISMNNSGGSDKSGDRYLSASVNAETGEILSINNYGGEYVSERKLTERQRTAADKAIDAFLSAAAGEKLAECERNTTEHEDAENESGYISRSYTRLVNGVKYINNGISVVYDGINERIDSYSLTYDSGDFADPASAISEQAAYDRLLEQKPIEYIYILSGGIYKLCCGWETNGNIQLDAVSGELINKANINRASDISYSDISGHWSEKAVSALMNVGIAFDGDTFRPDTEISQSDLLRLFGAAAYYEGYLNYDDEELYRMLSLNGVITDTEKNPSAPVKREDACVFLIRMIGAEKYAKLESIYKVSFADMEQISPGRIGYIALLSGLGVICGDGGNVRPSDNITRAEAAVMLYNYLAE